PNVLFDVLSFLCFGAHNADCADDADAHRYELPVSKKKEILCHPHSIRLDEYYIKTFIFQS
ncbi:MAG: hypothetical protein OIN87_12430, partial [Candidatus Methanoperedens sp.]|nr:hypothetical protein [Candidatus Methanoperedens sp.]